MTATHHITTIDGHYTCPQRAAAYLLVDGDEAAFVDNVKRFAVPDLLAALNARALSPEQVRYIIVTHVHLDHSGGTAELLKHCPNATVIAHPRAGRHLIDPSKLIAAARPIYGDELYEREFGVIEPVPAERVQIVEEGDTLPFGARMLEFLHTPGHAKHHLSVIDPGTESALTGDAYGLAQLRLQTGKRPFMTYVCSPPDFSLIDAKESIRKIKATGVRRVFVTHYGELTQLDAAMEQMYRGLDAYQALCEDLASTDLEGDALVKACSERALTIIEDELRLTGLDPADKDIRFWATIELSVTAQGLATHTLNIREGK